MYRSARGTKHFGYRQLDADQAELSVPMQRSLTSVHPKQHERRTDSIGFRIHGRSNISSHKVAPLNPVSKQEELLINFDDDCSAAPQTTSTVTASQPKASQSSAGVLSLLDSSIAEKYESLPPALGEKHHVPFDPFEISEDLKHFMLQNVTPLCSDAVTPSQQHDTSSLHHSWSSFDSFSSQDVNEGSELGSPAAAAANSMFASATASHALAVGAASVDTKTASETDLLTYANIPQWTGDDHQGRQMSNYSSRHAYSFSDANRPRTRRRRRCDQQDQLASRDVISDLNANSVVQRPVSMGNSVDWASDAVSQLSVRNTIAGQSAAVTSSAIWDGRNLSKHMKNARKKMPNTGSVFYDDADDTREFATGTNSWNTDNSAPPVPPRDYVRDDTTRMTQSSDAIYGNISKRNQSIVSSDIAGTGTRQLAEVRPFVQASADVYQNYSEFSQSLAADSADHSVYVNVKEQSSTQLSNRSSLAEAIASSEVGQFGAAVHPVRRRVPAATAEDCQAALVCCYGDVEAAIKQLKVQQLTRLGIAPQERCQMLLEACNWNLESAGSVLLHELSTGSPV